MMLSDETKLYFYVRKDAIVAPTLKIHKLHILTGNSKYLISNV